MSYFDFEGVIPKGEYGGGDVIVWDWGTWQPEETDNPARAVARGRAQVQPRRREAQGPLHDRQDARPTIRHEGRLAAHPQGRRVRRPDWNVDALPRSVKTGRTNDEVAAGADAIWDSSAPADEAKHRPVRRRGGAAARLHRSDEGDGRRQGLLRPRLAVRAQARRLSRRGGRRRRQRAHVDAQQAGRGDAISPTWPPRRPPGSVPSRRSSTARSWRSTRRATPASSCCRRAPARCVAGPSRRHRSSTTSSTFSITTVDRCSTCRSSSASELLRSVLRDHPLRALWQPHRRRRRGLPRRRQAAPAGGHGRQAANEPVRARPAFSLLAEDQGPPRAGGRRGRLRTGPARSQGTRLTTRRGQRGREAALRRRGGQRFRRDARAASGAASWTSFGSTRRRWSVRRA